MGDIALDQLKSDFEMFRDQCRLLFRTRRTFESLYDDEFIRELLFSSAKLFFDDLHRLLIDAYFLQVGRITDPTKTNRNMNLSAPYIATQLNKQGRSTGKIETLLDGIDNYRIQTKAARHKFVAHNDLKSFREQAKLGGHEWQDMQDFLDNIVDFTDCVARQLDIPPEDYRTQAGEGDVIDLIRLLKRVRKQKEKND